MRFVGLSVMKLRSNLAGAYSVCKRLVGDPEDKFFVRSIVDGGFDIVLQLTHNSS